MTKASDLTRRRFVKLATGAAAQWTQTAGPDGGTVTALATDKSGNRELTPHQLKLNVDVVAQR